MWIGEELVALLASLTVLAVVVSLAHVKSKKRRERP